MDQERIENLSAEICENYCKYPDIWDEDLEGTTLVDAICS